MKDHRSSSVPYHPHSDRLLWGNKPGTPRCLRRPVPQETVPRSGTALRRRGSLYVSLSCAPLHHHAVHGRTGLFRSFLHPLGEMGKCLLVCVQHRFMELLVELLSAGKTDVLVLIAGLITRHGDKWPILAVHHPPRTAKQPLRVTEACARTGLSVRREWIFTSNRVGSDSFTGPGSGAVDFFMGIFLLLISCKPFFCPA